MELRGQPQDRERTPVPCEQEAVCAPDPVETFWRTEKYLSTAGIRTAGRPSSGFAPLPSTLTRPSLLLSMSRLVLIYYLRHILLHNTHTIIRHTLLYGAVLTRNWVPDCTTDCPVGHRASSVVRFTARNPMITQAHRSVQQCSYKLYSLYVRTGAFSRF